jgi:hypothetical protein
LSLGGSAAEVPQPKDVVRELTTKYYENFKNIQIADVIIMTLGLVEVWRDLERGVDLNIAPPKDLIAAHPGRFVLSVMSYEDILGDLEGILTEIARHCKPTVRILITVSPVPLHVTFRGKDCLEANMYSKAVQRAVVEAFCQRHPEIAYFPSFEMVMLSSPEQAWVPSDFRHVRPELVRRIMRSVLSKYLEPGTLPPDANEMSVEFKAGKYGAIVEGVDAYLARQQVAPEALDPGAQYVYASACEKLGNIRTASKLAQNVLTIKPRHVGALKLLARVETAGDAA